MARIRQNITYSDTRAELTEYKDARRGACEDAFWDEDELVDYRRSPASRKKRKRAPGCEGNDGGPHIYVWTSEREWEDAFFRYFGFHKYEYKRCAGCWKRGSFKSRLTERYVKKFNPAGKYSYPERNHAGYQEFRERQRALYGWRYFY